ncbi:hypothetical protein cyc_02474 [Cyclospora cayetanensis]|uniref:PPM-type phosphatase domain-containing protein n=1 Tax=Cyclospora cayetanensis TaxID=88456 RepID=A0A1D3D3Y0_9EIME|nr:hypothetical protein cyc_02474 [Cyclospora cayetanensis]
MRLTPLSSPPSFLLLSLPAAGIPARVSIINNRMGGLIEPTRSIGDFDVKARLPPRSLSIEPEVGVYSLASLFAAAPSATEDAAGGAETPGSAISPNCGVLLLATDGVWDFVDASDVLKCMQQNGVGVAGGSATRAPAAQAAAGDAAAVPSGVSFQQAAVDSSAAGSSSHWESPSRGGRSSQGGFPLLPLALPTPELLSEVCHRIVKKAIKNGSTDDCTCLAAFLYPVSSSGSACVAAPSGDFPVRGVAGELDA